MHTQEDKVGMFAATLSLFAHCERSRNASLYISGIVVDSSQALFLILPIVCTTWLAATSGGWLCSPLQDCTVDSCSYFRWTLASVSLTSSKCVILAIINLVWDYSNFAKEVLPLYFKHSNFNSIDSNTVTFLPPDHSWSCGSWYRGSWSRGKLIWWELTSWELISWELISWAWISPFMSTPTLTWHHSTSCTSQWHFVKSSRSCWNWTHY